MCSIPAIVFVGLFLPGLGFGQNGSATAPVFTKLPQPPFISPPPTAAAPKASPTISLPPNAATPEVSPATSPLQPPPSVPTASSPTSTPVHSPASSPALTPAKSPVTSEVPSTAASPTKGDEASLGPSISSPEIADGPVGDESGSGRSYVGLAFFSGFIVWVVLVTI